MVVCCSIIIIILVLALVSLLVLQKVERLVLEGQLNESRMLATHFELAYNRERLWAERAADDAKMELDRCMVASQAEHRWLQLKLAAVQTQLRKSATRLTWQEKEMRSQKALLEIARQSLIRLDTRNARIVATLRQCKVTSRDLRRRVIEEREVCMERTGGYRLSPDNNMLVHPRNAFRYSAGRVYYEH